MKTQKLLHIMLGIILPSVMVILFGYSSVTYADGWEVYYTTSTLSNIEADGQMQTFSNEIMNMYAPPPPGGTGIQYGLDYPGNCEMHTQATLQWVGNSMPPTTVTVLEAPLISVAYGFGNNPPLSVSVDDGSGDTMISDPKFYENGDLEGYTYTSSGFHVTVEQVSGNTVTLPQRTLSLTIQGPTGDVGGEDFAYSAIPINPCSISGSSTGGIGVGPTTGYFSGTDCKVSGSVALTQGQQDAGDYITSAQLMLDGTTVASYTDSGTHQSPTLSAVFDSTHFTNGAKINAEMQATDSQGNQYGAVLGEPDDGPPFSVSVKNSAYIVMNSTQAFQLTCVQVGSSIATSLDEANYNTESPDSANATQILSSLLTNNVFYISTHGGDNNFGDSTSLGDYGPLDSSSIIYFSEVKDVLTNKSSSQPPYNFVMIDGCFTGGNPGNYSSFGLGALDTAGLGYDHEMWVAANAGFTETLFTSLAAEYNLIEAALIAIDADPPIGSENDTISGIANPTFYLPVILFDPATKLRGLYGLDFTDAWYGQQM